MVKKRLRPGALDEIAEMIDAKSDQDLAKFLALTVEELEAIRYGAGIDLIKASDIVRRRDAHLKAVELLDQVNPAA